MTLTILFDRLRWEEKALKREAEKEGCDPELLDAKRLALEVSKTRPQEGIGEIALQRCISHYRALNLTKILEAMGHVVVNSSEVTENCGSKLLTTLLLARAKIPTPRTYVALTSETVARAAAALGFPLVMKPMTGSWGRMVSIVKDEDTLQSMVELREQLQNPAERMYYLQEFVKRPPRDIRAVVSGDEIAACVYRYAPEGEWRTNVARGGISKSFKPDGELKELIHRAAEAVGGGVLGVDMMESKDGGGYLVHEVNNTVEFRGAQSATETNIPHKIIRYVLRRGKK